MKQREFDELKEGDKIKLNFASSKQYSGRFNTYDNYIVLFSRSGKMIKDDNGANRFLSEFYKHFHMSDKWN